jgi:hypothetical protein
MDREIAGCVVIRHTCRCDGAVEKTDDDAATEHVFTVDGEDFPWYISERGPIVKRLRDDLYSIDVEIYELSKSDKECLSFEYRRDDACSVPYIPVIGGKDFPWLLTADEMTLTFGHKILPMLHLAFFAHEVDANIPVEDCRPDPQDVYCGGGNRIA